MPALQDPVSPDVRRTLRRAVLNHAASEHRRRHPALVHVGTPGAEECIVPAVGQGFDEPDDHTLRVDVLAALFRRVASNGSAIVWLTRAGDLELQDVDAVWVASAQSAAAEAGIDLTMVVVNRHGWRDPRTGAAAHWKRLRPR